MKLLLMVIICLVSFGLLVIFPLEETRKLIVAIMLLLLGTTLFAIED